MNCAIYAGPVIIEQNITAAAPASALIISYLCHYRLPVHTCSYAQC